MNIFFPFFVLKNQVTQLPEPYLKWNLYQELYMALTISVHLSQTNQNKSI